MISSIPTSKITMKGGEIGMANSKGSGSGKGNTTLKGRSAVTGRFMPVDTARQRPNTAVVERVPKPGRGVK
jgi:hypothetical protein